MDLEMKEVCNKNEVIVIEPEDEKSSLEMYDDPKVIRVNGQGITSECVTSQQGLMSEYIKSAKGAHVEMPSEIVLSSDEELEHDDQPTSRRLGWSPVPQRSQAGQKAMREHYDQPSYNLEQRFVCKQCGIHYRTSLQLATHMPHHNGPVKCELCDSPQIPQGIAMSHIDPGADRKRLNCTLCSTSFASYEEINAHALVFHTATNVNDSFTAEKTEDSQMGLAVIDGENDRLSLSLSQCITLDSPYTCDSCEVIFGSTSSPYMCPICSVTFPSLSKLAKHKRDNHFDGPFRCGWCGIRSKFADKNLLYRHIRKHMAYAVEKRHRNFVCDVTDVCDEVCMKSTVLNVHKSSQQPRFNCDKCAKWFNDLATLKKHKLMHGLPLPKCEICVKTFATWGKLKKHQRIHHVCYICNERFSSSSALEGHRITHQRERVTCDKCARWFIDSAKLEKHKLVHQLPRKCEICDKTCISPSALKIHMKRRDHVKGTN